MKSGHYYLFNEIVIHNHWQMVDTAVWHRTTVGIIIGGDAVRQDRTWFS